MNLVLQNYLSLIIKVLGQNSHGTPVQSVSLSPCQVAQEAVECNPLGLVKVVTDVVAVVGFYVETSGHGGQDLGQFGEVGESGLEGGIEPLHKRRIEWAYTHPSGEDEGQPRPRRPRFA